MFVRDRIALERPEPSHARRRRRLNPKRKVGHFEAMPGDPECSGTEEVRGSSIRTGMNSAKERVHIPAQREQVFQGKVIRLSS